VIILVIICCLLFVVSEHSGQQAERSAGDDCPLPLIANAESSCATTRAVEVCVNGVKQVIIVPVAQSSNVINVVPSVSLPLSSSSSSFSSVNGRLSLDDLPEDVKLLAEFYLPVTSSSSIPSFTTPAASSTATDGHSLGHTRSTAGLANDTIPAPYQMFSTSRMPLMSAPTEVLQSLSVTTTQPNQLNSVNRMISPSFNVHHHSPQFHPLSAPVLPTCGFTPAQQQSSATVPLQQMFPFPAYRNTVLHGQVQPDLNHLPRMLPVGVGEASWTPFSTLQMRPPTYRANNSTMDRMVNNCLQPAPTFTAQHPVSQLPLSNYCGTAYQHFLPSLQSAINPQLSPNQPAAQFQDYLWRKRGVLPQNTQRASPVDTVAYRMPHLQSILGPGRGVTFERPVPPVSSNEMRTNYSNGSSLSSLRVHSQTSARYRDRRKHATVSVSGNSNISHSLPSMSQANMSSKSLVTQGESHQLPLTDTVSQIYAPIFYPPPAYSTVLTTANHLGRLQHNIDSIIANKSSGRQLKVSNTLYSGPGVSNATIGATTVIPTPSRSLHVTSIAEKPTSTVANKSSGHQWQFINTSYSGPGVSSATVGATTVGPTPSTSLHVTSIAAKPTSTLAATTYTVLTANLSALPQNRTNVLCSSRPVTCIPTDLQVTVNQTQPAFVPITAIAMSSVTTVTTYVTETTSRPIAAAEASVAAAKHLILSTILSEVSYEVASIPSSCTLTSNVGLSNFLSTDLFPPSLVSVAGSVSGTLDATVQPASEVGTGTSQCGDNSNDLGSLPADVMVDGAESESLLTSFCDMFEQSDAPPQSSAGRSSVVTSDKVENAPQRKDVSVGVSHESAERGLLFAKSLGKGRHFADEMRERRAGRRKKRRVRLTSLEFADESNSSDSWHPDSHSESSEYQSPSSPSPSTASSVSQSSSLDDFVVKSPHVRTRRMLHAKRKHSSPSYRVTPSVHQQSSSSVDKSAHAATQKCSVVLERIQLHGQCSVNVYQYLVDRYICSSGVRSQQRVVSSDSECSTADDHSSAVKKKLRAKILRVEDTDSS